LIQPNRDNRCNTNDNHSHRPAKFPKASPETSSVRLPCIITRLSFLILNLSLHKRVSGPWRLAGRSICDETLKQKKRGQAKAWQPSQETEFENSQLIPRPRDGIPSICETVNEHKAHLTKVLCGRKDVAAPKDAK